MYLPYKMLHFAVQELVPEAMYERFGDESIRYVDPRLIAVLNSLRKQLGVPVTINSWHIGGARQWSGIRTSDSPYFSEYSAHSFGMAFDAVGPFNVQEVQRRIMDGDIVLPYPIRLELGVNWLHIDVMNTSELTVTTFRV